MILMAAIVVLLALVWPSDAHIQSQIRSGQVPVRGVSLGGWLVAEYWMTKCSSIWQGVSKEVARTGEISLLLGSSNVEQTRATLETHQATFITEKDIAEIARAGLNTIRVPVGYWVMPMTSQQTRDSTQATLFQRFPRNTLGILDSVFRWGNALNVAVLLDLHAAMGSQNGLQSTAPIAKDQALWANNPVNIENTVNVVRFLTSRYRSEASFLGISVLNEPGTTIPMGVLQNYYQQAFHAVRAIDPTAVVVIAPPLTQQVPPVLMDFLRNSPNVWVDWHPYFKWGFETKSKQDILGAVHGTAANIARWIGNPLLIGEWSLATAGQIGEDVAGLKEFATLQLQAYNQAKAGWVFWSWRVCGDETGINVWSMRNLLRNGLLKW